MLRRVLPQRLSPRLWLISLPSALITFERRQRLPRLPIGRLRLLGLPLMGAGAAFALWSWRRTGPAAPREGPLARLYDRPGVTAGLLLLAGLALLLRSLVLAAYSLALAFAATTDAISIDEPRPDTFLRRDSD